jgi:hypothetical protein
MTLAAQAGPDEITFVNGDKLVGTFVSASDSSVTFKTDVLGELTVKWAKVKELHTTQKVALIRKGVELKMKANTANIPQGTLTVQDQKAQVAPSTESIPVADTNVIIEQTKFEKAMTTSPGFFHDWRGAITAGATVVQATQDNRTFNGALTLVRSEPSEDWLNPKNRTAFTISDSYGEVSEPATPTIKTSIFHAGLQRDEYFTPSLYGFGQALFDHNYSQGLNLQQTYAGGIGWTVVKSAVQFLNVSAAISYTRQDFTKGPEENLIGSVFAEHYNRTLPYKASLDQQASVTPAWNNTNAWSAAFSALVTVPVYKRLGGSTGLIDTYLNNPPAGFKKNSLQFTLGLTYSIQ